MTIPSEAGVYASATEGEDGGVWIEPGIIDGNDGSIFNPIIDVRNSYKVGRGYDSAISDQVREIHAVAKRVETGLSPAEFEKILREDFGLTLDSYADLMSKCLV